VDECERVLRAWIDGYVLAPGAGDAATAEDKASRPLAEASIEVKAKPERPDHPVATVCLKPQYQLVPPPLAFERVVDLGDVLEEG
jgi:predicted component of type VI protein secretion system